MWETCVSFLCCGIFFFFGGTGVCTQGFMLAKQAVAKQGLTT
jgi:hypothetical protein